MTEQEIADQQYTIEHYLHRSARQSLPLQRGFVMGRGERDRPIPGPLAQFVRRGREKALEQYLLAHAIASRPDDETGAHTVSLPAHTWARMIDAPADPETGKIAASGLQAVSRNWKFLRDLKLITTQQRGRRALVTLLSDDGLGRPYAHEGRDRRGRQLEVGQRGFFQLPYHYWTDRYYTSLDLKAKAVLLIALGMGDGFSLPTAKVPAWYGISETTAKNGIKELVDAGILHQEKHRRPDPESPVGFSIVAFYELKPPFGPRGHRSSSAPPKYSGQSPFGLPRPKESA